MTLPMKGARAAAHLFTEGKVHTPELLLPQAAPAPAALAPPPPSGFTFQDFKELLHLAKELGIDVSQLFKPRAAPSADQLAQPQSVLSQSVRRETIATPAVREVVREVHVGAPPELTPDQRALLDKLRALSDKDAADVVGVLYDMAPRDVIIEKVVANRARILDAAAHFIGEVPPERIKLALMMLAANTPAAAPTTSPTTTLATTNDAPPTTPVMSAAQPSIAQAKSAAAEQGMRLEGP